MSDWREVMMDEVCKKYGFECKKTIKFFMLAETEDIKKVEKAFKKLMKM